MNKIKYLKIRKILLLLLITYLILLIIRMCNILEICCTIINLISPIFFGFAISWILKPIVLYLNKYISEKLSIPITYSILIVIISIISYFFIPVLIKEVKNIIPFIIDLFNKIPKEYTKNIDMTRIGKRLISCTSNIKNILLNIFYSVFISYYFLVGHKSVTKFISKYTPSSLINEISTNLKAFVKGTLLDTLILFIMSIILLTAFKMPYALLFSIVISLTNIIPFIGPYIGGVPAILVGLSVNLKLGITITIIVILLQFVESSFIHPLIMSKSLNLHPISIIISLIIFGYLFGVIGMLISTPILSVIKSLYLYYKKRPKKALNR